MNDYKKYIYEILREAVPYEEISDTTELIKSGIIDSLTLVFLIAELEEATSKTISEDLVTPENFESVERINRLLNSID